jgi:hypothetical protein
MLASSQMTRPRVSFPFPASGEHSTRPPVSFS